jgi:DNA polymerase III alpha subunit
MKAGAFDEFGDRSALLAAAPAAHAAGQKRQADREVGQNSLFGGDGGAERGRGDRAARRRADAATGRSWILRRSCSASG